MTRLNQGSANSSSGQRVATGEAITRELAPPVRWCVRWGVRCRGDLPPWPNREASVPFQARLGSSGLGWLLSRFPIAVRTVSWRRERDSNPRSPLRLSGFQDRLFQPLTHPSALSGSGHASTNILLPIRLAASRRKPNQDAATNNDEAIQTKRKCPGVSTSKEVERWFAAWREAGKWQSPVQRMRAPASKFGRADRLACGLKIKMRWVAPGRPSGGPCVGRFLGIRIRKVALE